MSKKLKELLRAYWGGNLIPIFLTKIEWVDKTTGEPKHAFAYSSNPSTTVSGVGPSNLSFRLTVQGVSSNSENNITLWAPPEMNQEMCDLYHAEGYGVANYNLDTESIEYPTQEAVQSDEAYQTA